MRTADAHQVSRTVLRQDRCRDLERQPDLVTLLADAHPTHGVAVEIEVDQCPGAGLAEVGVTAPLDDPEEGLVGPIVGLLATRRPPDRPFDAAFGSDE